MRSTTALLVLCASLLAAAMPATAEAPIEHAALATQYEEEAAALRDKANLHRQMLERSYRGPKYSKVRRVNVMQNHCKRLIEDYDRAAAEAASLASEHRKAAADH